MAIQCLKCKYILRGKEGLHLVNRCPNCDNTEIDFFKRIDDEDIDPEQKEKEKELLESHRKEKTSSEN